MITKDQFIQSLNFELTIMQHLAEKVTPAMLDYRPTPGQRSTLELMRYLGHVFETAITLAHSGDMSAFRDVAMAAEAAVTAENFSEKMEAQKTFITTTIGALSDAQLEESKTIFNTTAPLSMHLLGMLKWAAAYKTQLFLYIKANGVSDIGTSNLWGGVDMPPRE